MATVQATLDPLNFPGAERVAPYEGGYIAYGPAKDGKHRAIAIMRNVGNGKYIIDAETAVTSTLLGAVSLSTAEVEAKAPVYETTVEFKKGSKTIRAVHYGPKPTGATLAGHKILSTKPALGWTLKKLREMEYQIQQQNDDHELDVLAIDDRGDPQHDLPKEGK